MSGPSKRNKQLFLFTCRALSCVSNIGVGNEHFTPYTQMATDKQPNGDIRSRIYSLSMYEQPREKESNAFPAPPFIFRTVYFIGGVTKKTVLLRQKTRFGQARRNQKLLEPPPPPPPSPPKHFTHHRNWCEVLAQLQCCSFSHTVKLGSVPAGWSPDSR